jgi:hypothetical protein
LFALGSIAVAFAAPINRGVILGPCDRLAQPYPITSNEPDFLERYGFNEVYLRLGWMCLTIDSLLDTLGDSLCKGDVTRGSDPSYRDAHVVDGSDVLCYQRNLYPKAVLADTLKQADTLHDLVVRAVRKDNLGTNELRLIAGNDIVLHCDSGTPAINYDGGIVLEPTDGKIMIRPNEDRDAEIWLYEMSTGKVLSLVMNDIVHSYQWNWPDSTRNIPAGGESILMGDLLGGSDDIQLHFEPVGSALYQSTYSPSNAILQSGTRTVPSGILVDTVFFAGSRENNDAGGIVGSKYSGTSYRVSVEWYNYFQGANDSLYVISKTDSMFVIEVPWLGGTQKVDWITHGVRP